MHIKAIALDKYRGITNLKLDDLSRVNVIVGANNCGKTSVLEAISIMGDPQDMGRILRVALQHSQVDEAERDEHLARYAASVFSQGEMELAVMTEDHHFAFQAAGMLGTSVDANGVERETFTVTTRSQNESGVPVEGKHIFRDGELARYSPVNPLYNLLYLSSTTTNYYQSCIDFVRHGVRTSGKSEVLHNIQLLDSSVTDITLVGSEIYLKSETQGVLPLYSYGAGVQKTVCLAAALESCADSVILIDEIETAIHGAAFRELLRWFLSACIRLNIQAFVTTHSAEALDALINAAHEEHGDEDVLRVITLRKGVKTGNTIPLVRSGEEAYRVRECCELELRV